jgi:hypothetical protein
VKVKRALYWISVKHDEIFEKMVLTEGIRVVGRNPATTIAIAAAKRAYSIIS